MHSSDRIDEFRKDNWAQVAAVLAVVSVTFAVVALAIVGIGREPTEPNSHDYFGNRGGLFLALWFWGAIGMTYVLAGLSLAGGVAQLLLGHQPFSRIWRWWLLALAPMAAVSLWFRLGFAGA